LALFPLAADAERIATGHIAGVQFDQLTRFCILQGQSPKRWQLKLISICDLNRHEVMAAISLPKRGLNAAW